MQLKLISPITLVTAMMLSSTAPSHPPAHSPPQGKTETAKFFLNHLLSFEKGRQAALTEKQILETQPLLEAFGNAKTVLNNNSSRFGKYIEIVYHNGSLAGARIRKYLLEKSRVVHQADGEFNFHALYYIVAGCNAELRSSLELGNISDYRYFSSERRVDKAKDLAM